MKKQLKQLFLNLTFVFSAVLLCGLGAKQIHAATVSFYQSRIVMSEGEEVYLPYLTNYSDGIEFYTSDDSDDPVAWFVSDSPEHFGYNTLLGNKLGSCYAFAVQPNGEYAELWVDVGGRPVLTVNGSTNVTFQPAYICKEFIVNPAETGTYTITIESPVHSEIWIYEKNYDIINAAYTPVHNGTSYVTTLTLDMQGGHAVYADFLVYDSSSDVLTTPNTTIPTKVTVQRVPKATGVALHANAFAFKIENNTYYMLEGDVFDTKVVFEGVPGFKKEAYDIVSTNSEIARISSGSDEDTYSIECVAPGTADISVTTENMLTNSFKLVVLDPDEILAGDVNMDGAITKRDLEMIYSVINGNSEKTRIYYHADINQDNNLDDEDIKLLWESIGGLPYIDVNTSDWFYDSVNYNYTEGIMTGMNSIQFGPYESLSRAQFALILYRMQNEPEISVENPFKDIAGNEWYADAVLWAYENGIVNGFGDNTFRPVDLITREQMVAMMHRYANYLDMDNTANTTDYDSFLDASSVSSYADDAMRWAVANGILTGKTSDEGALLAPWGATARAEAAAIIQRFAN